MVRKRFKTVEQAAVGRSAKGYYVAELPVAALQEAGIECVPQPITPDGWDDSHAELPQLTAATRKTDEAAQITLTLAGLAIQVHGPFGVG